LIAVGDQPTPRSFVNGIASSAPTGSDVAVVSLISLWAWDSAQSKWYFYSPDLDNKGTLASYISSKGYLDFNMMPVSQSNGFSGFWINVP
jgi:hypothetical protein